MMTMMKGGKGKGKGGLRNFPAEKKVWIGNLPKDSTSVELNKKLVEHMKQAGNCKFAEVGKTGAGGAAFATAEEATLAISMLNGSFCSAAKVACPSDGKSVVAIQRQVSLFER